MKNNRGFTMIELLGAIVILAILSTVALVSIYKIIENSEKNYYAKQEDLLILAGKDYFTTNQSKLPKTIGETEKVYLETLIKLKYIDPVLNKKKEACSLTKTYVSVTKVSASKYKYQVYLECPGYKGEVPTAEGGTVQGIVFTPESKKSKTAFNVEMKINGSNIASYKYKIVNKLTTASKDSANKEYKGPIQISLQDQGVYNIIGYAYDKSGTEISKKSGEYIIDSGKPICGKTTGSNKTWTKSDVTVSVECKDDISGCKTTPVSKKFTTTTKTGEIEIADNLDNKQTCPVDVYVDKTAPTTPTITNPTNGNWTKDNFSLTLESTDSHSGISYYQYSYDETNWTTYQNSAATQFVTTPFSAQRNQYVYIRSVDKAGNISAVSKTMIRIDKTAPTTPTITNPTNGNWTKDNFSLTLESTDSYSGISYYQYSYDETNWTTYQNSAATKFVTTPFSAQRNQYAYIRVVDNVGNISAVSKTMIRIDKTAPTVSISNSAGGSCASSVKITATASDSQSGVQKIVYSTDNKATEKSNWSNNAVTWSSPIDITVYVRAYDKAGNVSAWQSAGRVCVANLTLSCGRSGTNVPTSGKYYDKQDKWYNFVGSTIDTSSTHIYYLTPGKVVYAKYYPGDTRNPSVTNGSSSGYGSSEWHLDQNYFLFGRESGTVTGKVWSKAGQYKECSVN